MANSQDSVSFSVGEAFDSYEALEKKLNEYKKAKFVEFWKRDSRTIEVAKKRIDRYMKPELKYYELRFCCIHGGQAFKPKGKGIRSTQ